MVWLAGWLAAWCGWVANRPAGLDSDSTRTRIGADKDTVLSVMRQDRAALLASSILQTFCADWKGMYPATASDDGAVVGEGVAVRTSAGGGGGDIAGVLLGLAAPSGSDSSGNTDSSFSAELTAEVLVLLANVSYINVAAMCKCLKV